MTSRAEYDHKRRSAKRAAGWREVAFHVPENVKGRIEQIASTFRLSREAVMQTALERGLAMIERREWYQRAKAIPFRLKRRDAGVCRMCAARLHNARECGRIARERGQGKPVSQQEGTSTNDARTA